MFPRLTNLKWMFWEDDKEKDWGTDEERWLLFQREEKAVVHAMRIARAPLHWNKLELALLDPMSSEEEEEAA